MAAILDAEALGHRDLDALDVVAVPDRLEHRVGEPQVEQLLEAHLPQEVVDAQELRLVDHRVQLGSERARGGEVVAERLLDDDARVLGEPGRGEALDDRAEQERRDLEVEDGRLGALDRLADARVRRRVAEIALDVGEPGREAREDVLDRASRRFPRCTPRACSRSLSIVQSFTATPTIGHRSSPRCSSRYSERKVMTFARSPVIPKTTNASACRGASVMAASVRSSLRVSWDPHVSDVAATSSSSDGSTTMRPARSCVNPVHVQSINAFARSSPFDNSAR